MTIHESILSTIGHTPIVRIGKLCPAHVNVYGKLEACNPGGSVKDRLAMALIEDAERRGVLRPGQTVIEATSGNTGIGLAVVCAQKGYPLVIVMAENFSVERRKLMRFLGARVVLTPAAQKGSGMLAKARELAEQHGWFLCRQFENEINATVHSETTAEEILAAFAGRSLDYFVTGFGTGGTLKGVARVLRERSPATRIIVCEPDNSRMLGSVVDESMNGADTGGASHPGFRPHLMQGWSPDFLSPLAAEAARLKLFDDIQPVRGDDALRCSRELARREGILTGISGGATLAGALAVASQAREGANILCMLPDTGERYLSTPLFADIEAEMTAEEIAISRSSPNYRFDAPATDTPSGPIPPARPVDDSAKEYLERVINDSQQPVVMFALKWCEFSWSIRRLLSHLRIPFRSIDLDSAEFQKDDRGGQLRAALQARTAVGTIPQIFIGGEFVGGCTDLFDQWHSGNIQRQLDRLAIPYDRAVPVEPFSFLPTWLHPRRGPQPVNQQGDTNAHLRRAGLRADENLQVVDTVIVRPDSAAAN